MKQAIEFEGVISKGHLEPHIRQSIARVINSMDNKRIRVSIAEAKKRRSTPQNRFYFGCIVPAVREFMREYSGQNLSLDETHEMIVRRVWKLTKYIETPDRERLEVRQSSTELDTISWEQRIDMTRAYFAPVGLMLPYPNEGILPV